MNRSSSTRARINPSLDRITLFILASLLAFALPGCQTDSSAESAQPPAAESQQHTPKIAFDPDELSTTVRPQDDFWEYVNGQWLSETEIPADRSSHGTFWQLIDRTEERIHGILENVANPVTRKAQTPAEITIRNLYTSYLDQDALEAAGLAPLTPYLEKIEAIDSVDALIQVFGEFAAIGVTTPITFYADNDAKDQTRLLLYLWQSGLGLPNRDYYLKETDKLSQARTNYIAHIENMFTLAGWANGKQAAADVFALELKLAQAHWTQVQSRDRQKIYSNQYSLEAADALTEQFALPLWLESLGAGTPHKLVLAQTEYFEALGQIVQDTELATWKAYLKLHLIKSFASFLPQTIDDEQFDFQGRKLRGQTEQALRWKRAVRFVNGSAGELLGQLYVKEFFPAQAKGQINELVENLRTAYGVSIRELKWMSDATKEQALLKLDAFLPKLGYPDTWRDFSGLKTSDDLFGNVVNARRFNHAYNLGKLNKPVDRNEWTTNPQTVNAFYRPTHNSITFPAGILQRPMFEADADPAMNYGAIGSIIGHEFSHGFDDQGRKFDGHGLLRNWWTDADAEQYQTRATILVDQFANYQPLADTNINGELTLGENIGDLAGVIMSYRAFELSGLADGPSIAGLTPRQRFFVGYALAFRGKTRPEYLRELLLRDTHSPVQYRVLGVLRNMQGFYDAFDVQAGDGMYLPPRMRAKIW